MNKSIYFDATALQKQSPTGVELYARSILPVVSNKLLNEGYAVKWLTAANLPLLRGDSLEIITLPYKRCWNQTVLLQRLNQDQPALYLSPSNFPPLMYKGRTFSVVHDMALYHDPDSFNFMERLKLGTLGRLSVKKSEMIIVPSHYTKKDLVEYWKIDSKKIEVIHSGALAPISDCEAMSELIDKPFYLYIGRIEKKKNLMVILDVFEKSIDDFLVLAGSFAHKSEEIFRRISQMPLEKQAKIILPGYVSDAQKKWLYQQCKAVFVPCLYEGFGFPILEAWQNGAVPICANQGALPEIGGEAALYIEKNTVSGWEEAIAKLNIQTIQDIKNKGELKLREYNWERTAQSLTDLIVKIIKENE